MIKRRSGVLMHISSLWGEYSSGSFGKSAYEWIDFLADCGFKIWQVLPFCLPDDCNSPYKSYSAFSLNPYFIDLDMLKENGLLTEEECREAKQHSPYVCEFDRLKNERMKVLEKAMQRFQDNEKLDEFFSEHKKTDEFCRFMALKAVNGFKAWNLFENNEPSGQEYRLWRFTQYIFFTQWQKIKKYANDKGVLIIGDVPIYVAYDSSDVYADKEQFLLDENDLPRSVAGVPPDYFCEDGQLWGNPIYNWDNMRKDGFSWWRERMAFMCELFDGVRLDHFRGIESYYSIPFGAENAKNGKWVDGPKEDFVDAIKEVSAGRLIIAEDLGDITDEVRELVEKSGFPGMRVLQFGFLGDSSSPHLPHNYIENSVSYTGTHDNNTLLGYVWEIDPQTRKRLFGYCGYFGDDWNEGCQAIIRTMFESHSAYFIMPVQDLLLYGSDTRLNTPGRAEGNWGYRITREQLDCINREHFKHLNGLYGR